MNETTQNTDTDTDRERSARIDAAVALIEGSAITSGRALDGAVIKALRNRYQRALLAWLRDTDLFALTGLAETADAASRAVTDPGLQRFWTLAAGAVDVLSTSSAALEVEGKQMLAALEGELRRVDQHDEATARRELPQALLRRLLSLVLDADTLNSDRLARARDVLALAHTADTAASHTAETPEPSAAGSTDAELSVALEGLDEALTLDMGTHDPFVGDLGDAFSTIDRALDDWVADRSDDAQGFDATLSGVVGLAAGARLAGAADLARTADAVVTKLREVNEAGSSPSQIRAFCRRALAALHHDSASGDRTDAGPERVERWWQEVADGGGEPDPMTLAVEFVEEAPEIAADSPKPPNASTTDGVEELDDNVEHLAWTPSVAPSHPLAAGDSAGSAPERGAPRRAQPSIAEIFERELRDMSAGTAADDGGARKTGVTEPEEPSKPAPVSDAPAMDPLLPKSMPGPDPDPELESEPEPILMPGLDSGRPPRNEPEPRPVPLEELDNDVSTAPPRSLELEAAVDVLMSAAPGGWRARVLDCAARLEELSESSHEDELNNEVAVLRQLADDMAASESRHAVMPPDGSARPASYRPRRPASRSGAAAVSRAIRRAAPQSARGAVRALHMSDQQRARVMVVGGAIGDRRAMARRLYDAGCVAVVARDGVDALEMIPRIHPDLIVAEQSMPRMDGLALVERARSEYRRTLPAVIRTDDGIGTPAPQAVALERVTFVDTKADDDELIDAIRRLLGSTSA